MCTGVSAAPSPPPHTHTPHPHLTHLAEQLRILRVALHTVLAGAAVGQGSFHPEDPTRFPTVRECTLEESVHADQGNECSPLPNEGCTIPRVGHGVVPQHPQQVLLDVRTVQVVLEVGARGPTGKQGPLHSNLPGRQGWHWSLAVQANGHADGRLVRSFKHPTPLPCQGRGPRQGLHIDLEHLQAKPAPTVDKGAAQGAVAGDVVLDSLVVHIEQVLDSRGPRVRAVTLVAATRHTRT